MITFIKKIMKLGVKIDKEDCEIAINKAINDAEFIYQNHYDEIGVELVCKLNRERIKLELSKKREESLNVKYNELINENINLKEQHELLKGQHELFRTDLSAVITKFLKWKFDEFSYKVFVDNDVVNKFIRDTT